MRKVTENTLWYASGSADAWTSALPVGNGRLGAMVHGNLVRDRIQMNLDSLWARHKGESDNPLAAKHLDQVRSLLMDGRPDEAMRLANTTMMASPNHLQPYQTLGDLLICREPSGSMPGTSSTKRKTHKTLPAYCRWLDGWSKLDVKRIKPLSGCHTPSRRAGCAD